MGASDSSAFAVDQTRDADGAVRVRLRGELDLAVAGALDERLRSLARPGSLTRLDLSQLEFIDSSGIRILMRAIERASRDGGNLEVAPETTPAVRRTIELTGIAEHLWPSGGAEPDVPDAQEERGHG